MTIPESLHKQGNQLTTLMMKSLEEDATKALLELTAKSVMSPFEQKGGKITKRKHKNVFSFFFLLFTWAREIGGCPNLLHVPCSWLGKMQFP